MRYDYDNIFEKSYIISSNLFAILIKLKSLMRVYRIALHVSALRPSSEAEQVLRICCYILHVSNVSLQGCRRVRTKTYIHVISKNIFKVRVVTGSFSVVSTVLIHDHPLLNDLVSTLTLKIFLLITCMYILVLTRRQPCKDTLDMCRM
jgi:hypothetical protein